MKKTLLSLVIILSSAKAVGGETTGSISFTDDYRYRGISQTGGEAAIQGSINHAFENGVYAGIWGSNVAFGDDTNLEIDWYIGKSGSLTDDLTYDAAILYYQYLGEKSADIDYAEASFSLGYSTFTVNYIYTPDVVQSDEEGHYLALDYSKSINDTITLSAHVGRSFGDYWEKLDVGEYSDFSIALSTNAAGLDWSVSYLFNDIKSVNDINNGLFRNDGTLLFTVSKSL
jgi:uncharacterized protein (TIGR02001 family)